VVMPGEDASKMSKFYSALTQIVARYHQWTDVFEKFVDWRQCAAVMQRDAVTVMPSCSGGGNVVMA
jgi:hypothetical protein